MPSLLRIYYLSELVLSKLNIFFRFVVSRAKLLMHGSEISLNPITSNYDQIRETSYSH